MPYFFLNNFSRKRIVLIGCGFWGNNLIKELKFFNVLIGLFDINILIIDIYFKKHCFLKLTLFEFINSFFISSFFISSPTKNHYELSKYVLKNFKDVYVEKPISMKTSHVKNLIKLSKLNNCILMVGHIIHYHISFINLKKICFSKNLGHINYIYSSRFGLVYHRNKESVLWDLAPHDFSMFFSLLNMLYIVNVNFFIGKINVNNLNVVIFIFLEFYKNNINLQLYFSWQHIFKEQKFILVFNRGFILFDDVLSFDKKLQIYFFKIDKKFFFNNLIKINYFNFFSNILPLKLVCFYFLNCIFFRKKAFSYLESLNTTIFLEKIGNLID